MKYTMLCSGGNLLYELFSEVIQIKSIKTCFQMIVITTLRKRSLGVGSFPVLSGSEDTLTLDYRRLMQTLQIHLHPRKLPNILAPRLGVAVQQNWPIVI